MEYLVDLLLLGAVYLTYRSGRKELSQVREDLEARVGAVTDKWERGYDRNRKRINEHLQSRMHRR